MIVMCDNGNIIEAIECEYYFRVHVGNATWYWRKRDGKFDGVDFKKEKK